MLERAAQSVVDAAGDLLWSITSMLIAPTVLLLLLRKFAPPLGVPLWNGYLWLLGRLVVVPVRVVQWLYREATGRRGRGSPHR